jgi:SAM-dependent methyltransferase
MQRQGQELIDKEPYEPFVGFYKKHNISPVRQDVSDLARHFSRREYLYRYLGIPPFAIAGKSVVEFGPGSGHNALYTTSLGPARYVLVDANPRGFADTQALLKERFPSHTCHQFVFSYIQEFETDERFDVVLCEGVIPHQKDPIAFARHVGKFARQGGVLVVTTSDYVAIFAETLRRLIKDAIVDSTAPLAEQLNLIRPVFEPHFQSLKGASRPVDDWAADTIVNPWRHALFTIGSAIEALDGEFEIHGSSPRMLTDWRWYKEIYGQQAGINGHARQQYLEEGLSLIDYRFRLPAVPIRDGARLRELCEGVFWMMVDIETNKKQGFSDVAAACEEIAGILGPLSAPTAAAVAEAASFFRNPSAVDPKRHFKEFVPFFGRAQQYVSFVRV